MMTESASDDVWTPTVGVLLQTSSYGSLTTVWSFLLLRTSSASLLLSQLQTSSTLLFDLLSLAFGMGGNLCR
jgi:hypothetical protein